MQLLRVILIILIVYYLLKLIARYLLPVLLKYAVRKTSENIQKQYQQTQTDEAGTKKDDGVKKKPSVDHIGEYIDFEEIKE